MFKRGVGVGSVFGMIATLSFLWVLPSEVRYEEVVRLSQDRLADTMRRIEYYKAEHGSYPATLEAFAADIKIPPASERARTFVRHAKYPPAMMDPTGQYQSVFFHEVTSNGHYYLRARGPDGNPFTGDDIIPDVRRQPEGTIGLVEARVVAPTVVSGLTR